MFQGVEINYDISGDTRASKTPVFKGLHLITES